MPPRFNFPADFNAAFSDNHWSNTEKSTELFEKVIFPCLKQAKASLKYPKEQISSHGYFQRTRQRCDS